MKHETVAARIDALAMASGIVAGLAAAGAALATPSGLTAVGVWLGLVDEPLIVKLAPILDQLATGCGAISGFSYFLVQWRKRKFAGRVDKQCTDRVDNSKSL